MSANRILLGALALCLATGLGWWSRGWLAIDSGARDTSARSGDVGPCPGGAQPLYWKAPMDPTYVRDAPGKTPMGMDLVPHCPPGSAASRAAGDEHGSGGPSAHAASEVVIDTATVQKIGVRTAPVERRQIARSVRAAGRVAYDERRVVHIHTKVQGWVEELLVDFVGQKVERGEPLLEIYSPELVATQEELLLAARYRDATEQSPFDDVRGGGEALFEATQRRLELWDIPDRVVQRLLDTGEVQRTLTLYAPASGVVTELGVRSGMEVTPNANLYTIADLSRVWVLAKVYEYELPWLRLGQTASVELSYLPDGPVEAKLTYISPFLDPRTRTAELRLELDNREGRLKPEMFANVVVAGTPRANVIAVPHEAVIRSGTRAIAVVARGGGRFEAREVQLGLDSGDGWLEVRSGLEDGEEVVVSSQFLIDSESKLQEAIRKLLASDDASRASAELPHSGHSPPSDHSSHAEMGHE